MLIFRSLVSQVPSSHWTCLETICCQESQPPILPGCAANSVKVELSACIPPGMGSSVTMKEACSTAGEA